MSKRKTVDVAVDDNGKKKGVHDDNEGGESRPLLPVTLLSGFLGAGKTTLLKRVLRNKNDWKVAVIVNDMSSLNLDAREIERHGLVRNKEEMVELQNGCICCTLRGDLLKTVRELSREQKYDYLIIESTGIAEPLPVAQTFVMDIDSDGQVRTADDNDDGDENDQDEDDKGRKKTHDFEPLSKYARLDTLVTVLDTYNFFPILRTVETASERAKFFGPEDEDNEEDDRSIVQLLIDQIEFANVIVLNKVDLLRQKGDQEAVQETIRDISKLVAKLNPKATLLLPEKPKFEDFRVDRILNTQLFDMQEAEESAGWIEELQKRNNHTPETEEYGIGSFVFCNVERPFHPKRLARILNGFGKMGLARGVETADELDDGDVFAGVLRCKGHFWLATADACPIRVHAAGYQLDIEPALGSPWMAKVKETHPHGGKTTTKKNVSSADICRDQQVWEALEVTEETFQDLKAEGKWHASHGDRHSELVCIGIKMDKSRLRQELEAALLTPAEMKQGKKAWKTLEDVFFEGDSLWDLEDVMNKEQEMEQEDEIEESMENAENEEDEEEEEADKDEAIEDAEEEDDDDKAEECKPKVKRARRPKK